MTNYTAQTGQSIYDVCLQTYGTLNLLFKLLVDNKISVSNTHNLSGVVFIFDDELVKDYSVFNHNVTENIHYATANKVGKSFDKSFDLSFN